eukprot:2869555-Amphidinium_carterae.1
MVSVVATHNEISEEKGCGAGGSVHRATPKREAADTGAGLAAAGGPDSVEFNLVGGELEFASFRAVDTQLAALAVEAVAAAEVRRMAEDEAKRWEGRIFLPV